MVPAPRDAVARLCARLPLLACTGLFGVCVLLGAGADAATRYDPRLRFRTISTARFDIHYHQGGAPLARRLARFVEAAAAEVDASVGRPAGRVQIVLVDQHDLSNGWATPLPYNTIEISAAAPRAESLIGNTDDWLRLLFVHEYTHVAHLSQARGWIGGMRRVFGRHPLLFPNLYQPLWGIEGLATWQESTSTSQGRLPAGDFRHLLDTAAAHGRVEPLDRAGGGHVGWPGGAIPYLYGGYFHAFLAERYSAASLARLSDETARRVPYLAPLAYRRVFGRSLGALWREFQEATVDRAPQPEPARATRLTHHGFTVSSPRVAADGRIFYSSVTPHRFPALMEVRAPGAVPRRVATRYLGNQIGIAGRRLVIDEVDLVRSVGLQSDLYVVDVESGRRTRLTYERRASEPDISRDGRIVCVVQMHDRRALATVPSLSRPAVPTAIVSEPYTDFSSPRWSHDGRLIAAERRRLGGPSEIVLVDPADGSVRVVARLPGGRSASPAWVPDDDDVLFSAAANGEPFRIYRVRLATGVISRLEGTGSSAHAPAVAPDGTAVVFVGYTPDGYDLFSLPLGDAVWTPVDAAPASPQPGTTAGALHASSDVPDASRTYSPLRTLAPRSWTPVISVDAGHTTVGAAVASSDVLGRHAYAVQAAWSTAGRPDWQLAYAFDRWRPTLFASVGHDTDPWRGGTYRTRDIAAGMVLRVARVRVTHATLAAFQRSDEVCEACPSDVLPRQQRASARLGWQISSARAFGYSIGAEEGGRFSATLELPRTAFGADGNGTAVTADLRHYQRVWPQHGVIAVRAAAAGSWGDPAARRVFSASGHGPAQAGFDFGRGAIGLLRGFADEEVAGPRAAVANVDYRVPLVRIDRGIGTLPAFVRVIHGTVFADAGHAWTTRAQWIERRLSFGAELSADTVVGYAVPLTVTAGAAWRHHGRHGGRDVVVFGRIGRAF